MNRYANLILLAVIVVTMTSCKTASQARVELHSFPVENIEGVADLSGVMYDPEETYDGNGSLKLQSKRLKKFLLYEIFDLDVEEARMVYSAMVKTKRVRGQVYLEMVCDFFTRGEIETDGLQIALTGDNDWKKREIEFVLRRSENPVSVKLYLVINGSGTVWVDDIHLY
ncbi:MAG: hypothetical protein JKX97_05345, partial [Candidatus Lindowbacteria bacterium]|nr:hypothetical protein [Candidatus Lindowbacteria bacterium]